MKISINDLTFSQFYWRSFLKQAKFDPSKFPTNRPFSEFYAASFEEFRKSLDRYLRNGTFNYYNVHVVADGVNFCLIQ